MLHHCDHSSSLTSDSLRACLGRVAVAMRAVLDAPDTAIDAREARLVLDGVVTEATRQWADHAAPAIQAAIDAIDFWLPPPGNASALALARHPDGPRLLAALVVTAERLLAHLGHLEPGYREHLRSIILAGRRQSSGGLPTQPRPDGMLQRSRHSTTTRC